MARMQGTPAFVLLFAVAIASGLQPPITKTIDFSNHKHLASLLPYMSESGYFSLPNRDLFKSEIHSRLNSLSQSVSNLQLNTLKDIFAEPGEEILDFLFSSVNPVCANHSKHVFAEITGYYGRLPELWAQQMLDSWGKFPTSGILSGHVQVPGDFYECLQVRGNYSQAQSESNRVFKGRYCTSYIVPGEALLSLGSSRKRTPLDQLHPGLRDSVDFLTLLEYMTQVSSLVMFPIMGSCFPASCSQEEVQQIFSTFYAVATKDYLAQAVIACYTDEKPPLDAGDYSMIAVLSVIVCLCLAATFIDHYITKGDASKTDGTLMKSILAFSLKTNTIKWLSTRAGSENLGCLHGLRFLSISWVVFGHTMYMFALQYTWNLVDMKHMYKDWSLYVLVNGSFSVDTFFTLSGTLVTYNLLRELDKRKGKFNYLMFVIHRILRLTPTYMMIIGITATLLPYLGSGPGWYAVEGTSSNCEASWWHNMLYLNNFLSMGPDDKLCYGEAWYIANDMHFYLLSPLVILPLWRWKRVGFGLLGLLSILSMAIPLAITWSKELPPKAFEFIDIKSYYNDVYIMPYTRFAPYIAGMIMGYILHVRSKNPSKFRNLPIWFVAMGWIVSTVTALALIFGVMHLNDTENYDMIIHSWHSHVYAATNLFLWGLVIDWIIFACVTGYGSWVNAFLSWKVFMPLGRLTFCIYIASYHIQIMYHGSQPTVGYYNKINVVNIFFAHLVMSCLVSYILTMTLESPFIQLEKIIFAPLTSPNPAAPSKNQTGENNNDTVTKETHLA